MVRVEESDLTRLIKDLAIFNIDFFLYDQSRKPVP